ncbi:MAG: DedA family protein [Acidobacteriota bacterium]|nr:DedA family protein [Acidobacteriota bacterium]
MTLVLASITESLFNTAWHFVRDGGLVAIFLLMVADSACIPIPSEATMMFAGFAAASQIDSHAHHHLTIFGVVVVGVLGNLVGSLIAYAVGRAGRYELIERYGRWLHIKPSHLSSADRWFARYGSAAVLLGRVLPVVRTFISLPAGVAKMPFLRFTILTVIGCVPWVLGLALAGHAIGRNWATVRSGFSYADYVVLVLVVAWAAWAIVRRVRRRREHTLPA